MRGICENMRKYYLIAKNTWDEILSYRFNFALWRLRNLLNLFVGYFLWTAVIPEGGSLFGYTRDLMVTYILFAPLVASVALSSRTQEIAENINNGDLSLFLLKPIGYFKYWFARDFGDKAMNICFCVSEFALFILLFRPHLFLQTNIFYLVGFLISLILAMILYFYISCLLSMTGFWSPEFWAPRFIFYVMLTFFAGSLFPLDIMPEPVFRVMQLLPFGYLQYFPIKIYLGQLGLVPILQGWGLTLFWIFATSMLLKFFWNKGLKMFTAAGR
jgi:ABC-2 type transport system permease protein